MNNPIQAIRSRRDVKNGSSISSAILIAACRSNADLLRKIADRARRLDQARVNASASTLTAEDYAGGALIVNPPVSSALPIREVHFDCKSGRQPRILIQCMDGSTVVLPADLDITSLTVASAQELSERYGEISCPNCGFVNTKAGLQGDGVKACIECGQPAHGLLQSAAAVQA
jgi:hypothetical protein